MAQGIDPKFKPQYYKKKKKEKKRKRKRNKQTKKILKAQGKYFRGSLMGEQRPFASVYGGLSWLMHTEKGSTLELLV
jgi:hypothetical protein